MSNYTGFDSYFDPRPRKSFRPGRRPARDWDVGDAIEDTLAEQWKKGDFVTVSRGDYKGYHGTVTRIWRKRSEEQRRHGIKGVAMADVELGNGQVISVNAGRLERSTLLDVLADDGE